MELIKIELNKITINRKFIKNNLVELITFSNYDLEVILELVEALRDLKEGESMTYTNNYYFFDILKEAILDMLAPEY